MARHADEVQLFEALRTLVARAHHRCICSAFPPGRDVYDFALEALGMAPKRTDYLLDKWTRQGLFDWGVSIRTGWFTKRGIEVSLEGPGA